MFAQYFSLITNLYYLGPDKHILSLFSKWEASIGEKERLVSQISTLEKQFKEDIERQVNIAKQDSDNKVTDAVEKAKLEGKFIISFSAGHQPQQISSLFSVEIFIGVNSLAPIICPVIY